jgi:ubiquinone/menaquinone biosynthesis C-methylase UbiE
VRELFGSDASAYDARQYGARFRTFIADRQKLVSQVYRDLALPAGALVLDVACGPGHFLLEAASLGAVPVGIDGSGDMLRAASARLGEGAHLVAGDAEALPFEDCCFDVVNCSGLIEYIPEPTPLLREILRVLKPGRRALVSSTNRLSPALILKPLTDAVRRSPVTRRVIRGLRLPFDDMSLRERRFRMSFHTPGRLISMLSGAGFGRTELHYFHWQFLPHPLDRIAPSLATACVTLTDRFLSVRGLRVLAEGLLAVAQRPS